MAIGFISWLFKIVSPLPDVVFKVSTVELSEIWVKWQVTSNCPIGGSLKRHFNPPSSFMVTSDIGIVTSGWNENKKFGLNLMQYVNKTCFGQVSKWFYSSLFLSKRGLRKSIWKLCGVEDGHSLPFQRQGKTGTKWWHSQEHEAKKWSQLINSTSSIWRIPLNPCIVKILNLFYHSFIYLLVSHFFHVFIHYLQCIHCLLHQA